MEQEVKTESCDTDTSTAKHRVMSTLIDAGTSAEDIAWAHSHLPCTNSKGKVVPEGIVFSNIKYNHDAPQLNVALGLSDDALMAMLKKMEGIRKAAYYNTDGTEKKDHEPQSSVIAKMATAMTPEELVYSVGQALARINEVQHGDPLSMLLNSLRRR